MLRRSVTVVSALIPGLLLVGCDKGGLKGPAAEVRKSDVKLNLPAVPDFKLPDSTPDSRSIKEMRVKGKKLLESEITVKGIVTWAYDCPTSVRKPGMDDKAVTKLIEEDPTVCERAKFYIGDAADTPAEKSMWVVDVPRPFNKLELDRLTKEELKNPAAHLCDPRAKGTCPVYKVGDQVEVTGTWKLSSPHSERNSEGLLVYKKMKNVTQAWESPPPNPEATGAPPAGKASPEDLIKKKG